MFSKIRNIYKYSSDNIDIVELYNLVRYNSQSKLIDNIRYIRETSGKTEEYSKLKCNMPCIMPHGIFSGLGKNSIESISGYLYYDIDGFNNIEELNDTKKRLNDTFPISFMCNSLSNKGISFLIKLDDTKINSNDTLLYFDLIYKYVRSLLLDAGFNIDMSASGLSRKMIISSDKECILNLNNCLNINLNLIKSSILSDLEENKKTIKRKSIKPNDTFQIIPLKDLNLITETQYTNKINGNYTIDPVDYYRIIIPRIIKDGSKHRIYTRIINALYYLNDNITINQIFSYLYYVNKLSDKPMSTKYLYTFTNNICSIIEETGEIRIKTRIKKIHFSKESDLTKNEKMSMGAKLNGALRTNNTIEKINKVRNQYPNITQKKVSELTGLSISTIKRNWSKSLIDLDSIDITTIKKDIKLELTTIEECNFFK